STGSEGPAGHSLIPGSSGFDSRISDCCPRSVPVRTRPCEGRRSGSIPDGDTDYWWVWCSGSACDPVTVAVPDRNRLPTLERHPQSGWSRRRCEEPSPTLRTFHSPEGYSEVLR